MAAVALYLAARAACPARRHFGGCMAWDRRVGVVRAALVSLAAGCLILFAGTKPGDPDAHDAPDGQAGTATRGTPDTLTPGPHRFFTTLTLP